MRASLHGLDSKRSKLFLLSVRPGSDNLSASKSILYILRLCACTLGTSALLTRTYFFMSLTMTPPNCIDRKWRKLDDFVRGQGMGRNPTPFFCARARDSASLGAQMKHDFFRWCVSFRVCFLCWRQDFRFWIVFLASFLVFCLTRRASVSTREIRRD